MTRPPALPAPSPTGRVTDPPPCGRLSALARQWSREIAAGAALAASVVLLWGPWTELPLQARVVLTVFVAALVGWTVLRLDETVVAVAGALALVAAGAVPVEALHASLGQDLIWLMVASFVLAAVCQASGLVQAVALRLVRGPSGVDALLMRLALAIAATAFLVPSTSARAALLLPVFLVLARAWPHPPLVKAMALLFPTVILLSAGASLLGAGAHLVAVETLRRLGLPAPGFADWVLLAAPASLAASLLAVRVIARQCLGAEDRRRPLPPLVDAATTAPLTPAQRRVGAVAVAAVAGFATVGWHGVDASLVALAAALVATIPAVGGVRFRDAAKQVDWSLLLFLAGTLVMGQALVDSGTATRLAQTLVGALGTGAHPLLLVTTAAVVSVLAHLLVTSRTARVVVLLPALALPLAGLGANPAVLILLVTLGSGYCQTLTTSAKPLLVFARGGDARRFDDGDLMRLGLVLMPLTTVALIASTWGLWPVLGWAP